jgi:hypothetical protein
MMSWEIDAGSLGLEAVPLLARRGAALLEIEGFGTDAAGRPLGELARAEAAEAADDVLHQHPRRAPARPAVRSL